MNFQNRFYLQFKFDFIKRTTNKQQSCSYFIFHIISGGERKTDTVQNRKPRKPVYIPVPSCYCTPDVVCNMRSDRNNLQHAKSWSQGNQWQLQYGNRILSERSIWVRLERFFVWKPERYLFTWASRGTLYTSASSRTVQALNGSVWLARVLAAR